MSELGDIVAALRLALDQIETGIDEPRLSPAVLEHFKVTVDTVRTNLLAIITAKDPAEYHGFVRKFRLRRGAQACQSVLAGLVDGTINADTPGFATFRSTVDEALEGLQQVGQE